MYIYSQIAPNANFVFFFTLALPVIDIEFFFLTHVCYIDWYIYLSCLAPGSMVNSRGCLSCWGPRFESWLSHGCKLVLPFIRGQDDRQCCAHIIEWSEKKWPMVVVIAKIAKVVSLGVGGWGCMPAWTCEIIYS